MITYADVIKITCKAFEITQVKIADYINYHKSEITNFKKGQLSPQKSGDIKKKLLDKVFKKYAEKKGSKEVLCTLKDIIESSFYGVKEYLVDYWDETNYEKFVGTLLELAIAPPNKKKMQLSPDAKTTDANLKIDVNKESELDISEASNETSDSLSNDSISDTDVICKSTIAIDEKYRTCQYCNKIILNSYALNDSDDMYLGKCSVSGDIIYKNTEKCEHFFPNYSEISSEPLKSSLRFMRRFR